jgi:hypothetical protein
MLRLTHTCWLVERAKFRGGPTQLSLQSVPVIASCQSIIANYTCLA